MQTWMKTLHKSYEMFIETNEHILLQQLLSKKSIMNFMKKNRLFLSISDTSAVQELEPMVVMGRLFCHSRKPTGWTHAWTCKLP